MGWAGASFLRASFIKPRDKQVDTFPKDPSGLGGACLKSVPASIVRHTAPETSILPDWSELVRSVMISKVDPPFIPATPVKENDMSTATIELESGLIEAPPPTPLISARYAPSSPKLMANFEDYQYCAALGDGATSDVHLWRDLRNNEFIAAKSIKKSERVSKFEVFHEVSILRRLKHPFIVDFKTTLEDDECYYILLEYVAGGELFYHFKKAGRFSDHEAKFYVAQIIVMFEYLHSQNILYRDLKLENLVVDRDGYLKLIDFGISALMTDEPCLEISGTVPYLACEIVQDKTFLHTFKSAGHGPAADWWTLGILTYELLMGDVPFYTESEILNNRVKFPLASTFLVKRAAKDFIRQLLIKNPKIRLGSNGGAGALRAHRWLHGYDFEALLDRRLPPPRAGWVFVELSMNTQLSFKAL